MPKPLERLVGALYNDLALDGDTGEAAKYIAAHKPELIEEADRAAREHLIDILKEKGLLV